MFRYSPRHSKIKTTDTKSILSTFWILVFWNIKSIQQMLKKAKVSDITFQILNLKALNV